ncbi:MAG: hypothetical protein Q8N36_06175, partial [bacterium]|nr:hypothetical protein [bacterium]
SEGANKSHSTIKLATSVGEMVPRYIPPYPWKQDPLRIVIDAHRYGLSGFALSDLFRSRNFSYEMADHSTVVLVITPADDAGALESVREIAKTLPTLSSSSYERLPFPKQQLALDFMVSPRIAFYSNKENISLERAAGRIAATALMVYPPGIPLVWPGQLITEEIIECISYAKKAKFPVSLAANGDIEVITGVTSY